MPKLTKTLVASLPIRETPYILWDELLPGLGVRITPTGLRTFFLAYRTPQGDQRQVRLGRYLPAGFTPDEARAKALAMLAAIQAGADPRADVKARRAELTVNELLDRYLAEHVAVFNKARTERRVKQLVRLHIRPQLGAERLGTLTPAAIRRWHASMAGAPTNGNRALAVLRKGLSLAAGDWGLIRANPALRIRPHPEQPRTRTFTADELGRIGAVLAEAVAIRRFRAPIVPAIRLLALTGLRTSEVLGLRWSDIDVGGRQIALTDSKTGPRTLPLGGHALALLQSLDRGGSPWVLPSTDRTKAMGQDTLRGAWGSIRQEAGLGLGCGLHCFRRTAATAAAQAGASAFSLRDAFGWKGLAMPSRYVQRSQARGVPDLVGTAVAAALAGEPVTPEDGE